MSTDKENKNTLDFSVNTVYISGEGVERMGRLTKEQCIQRANDVSDDELPVHVVLPMINATNESCFDNACDNIYLWLKRLTITEKRELVRKHDMNNHEVKDISQ